MFEIVIYDANFKNKRSKVCRLNCVKNNNDKIRVVWCVSLFYLFAEDLICSHKPLQSY